MAIKVYLPENNQSERKYIVEVLFNEFLGLNIDILFGENQHYILELNTGKKLIIKDYFFSLYPKEKSYLNSQHIPPNIFFQHKIINPFIQENDLPVIFGSEEIVTSANEIICGVDIFGSAFFMLTRWEEYVYQERDHLDRFSAKSSLAVRAEFLHRPVVNEYIEMLWNMLCHLGIRQERRKHTFRLILTHDVDHPLLWISPLFFLKKLGGDMLKRWNLREVAFSLRSFALTKFGHEKDPYDTFDFLMQLAEKANVPAHFFFMAGGKSKFDPKYKLEQEFIEKLLARIHQRGHRIGIHPSFNSFDNEELFVAEKSGLEAVSPQPVTCGRQHFLRFSVPETWRIWENNKMEWDSSLGYPEQAGFRCGVCHPFAVFDILERKKLKLKEIPLLAMDTTFAIYQKYDRANAILQLQHLLANVKKYNGTFVLLWHNSSFDTPAYKNLAGVYEEFLSIASTS